MRRPESQIPEALRRVSIYRAASELGLTIPERPGTCLSPFREERNPSFSWYEGRDGRDRWKDFGTKEGGDTLDFIQKALGCDIKTATKELLRMAGFSSGGDRPKALPPLPPAPPRTVPEKLPAKHYLPADLHRGSFRELSELIESRRWIASPEDLSEPSETGALRLGTYQGHKSWLLVDAQQRCFEARRMDAKPWANGGKSSSRGKKSLLGVERLRPGCVCLLVEGAPDYLAAWILRAEARRQNCPFGSDCFPVAALGASSSVSSEDLKRFRGVRVLIFPHLDEAGQRACGEWSRVLKRGGAEVEAINLGPFVIPGGKDLADCINSEGFSPELVFKCQGADERMLLKQELGK